MKTSRNDTRDHVLDTGERLCAQRGFTSVGLIELLREAGIPKGSFYYYFPSKEAFGVAMLERYFARYVTQFQAWFDNAPDQPRQQLLNYYQQSLSTWCQDPTFAGCLSVKISAEVCDLSEAMRMALQQGSLALIAIISRVLEQAVARQQLALVTSTQSTAERIYTLWLGASLHSKICRSNAPLINAWEEMARMLPLPA
ncbi:TetR family transcriptional regulator [Erwinia sp. OLTSP20]|uniref:TetR/AcrR family transcriptional regulator n=1 Tax=unclassified Erwinia TaxID=2622719 RepID=UPI000C1986B8|nr:MULTISPECIES: TetR/AcrR family transcriptional regulator [unclassified Erwinia]PIJ51667.1 TetR family transcriptional regulator [Erwinia sp. OAMSP11]PIJ75554.1 TetR family transcriptional regulator [Erwinia sp. OLSSP12]PIJ84858.1 TetR family transcriptional regulator [Erwinia sp. OLCASP19]PIJ86637.1 TetR family transcriptional regulator [Erwinia sp. OLMTSP26]PIJ88078.1 TetR family transcriptional regulator [Erwinia sp. OLMDSP33]